MSESAGAMGSPGSLSAAELAASERSWARSMERASAHAAKQSAHTNSAAHRSAHTLTHPEASVRSSRPGSRGSVASTPAMSRVSSATGRSRAAAVPAPPALPAAQHRDTTHAARPSVHVVDWKPFDRFRRTEIVEPQGHAHSSSGSDFNCNEHSISIAGGGAGRGESGWTATSATKTSETSGTVLAASSGGKGASKESHAHSSSSSRSSGLLDNYSFEAQWRDHALRSSLCRRLLLPFLRSRAYTWLSVVLTLLALFLHDLSVAWLPPSGDRAVAGVLTAVFCLFVAEILLLSAVRRNYLATTQCAVDLVMVASLLLDVAPVFGEAPWNGAGMESQSAMTGATGATTVVRVVSVLRVARWRGVFRMWRLVRLVKLFSFGGLTAASVHRFGAGGGGGGGMDGLASGRGGSANGNGWSGAGAPPCRPASHSSRVGLHLSEAGDKRVAGLLLTLLIALPLLQAPVEHDAAPALGLHLLDQLPRPSAEFDTALASVVTILGGELLHLSCAGATAPLVDEASRLAELRPRETELFLSGQCRLALSVRAFFLWDSACTMLLSLLVSIIYVCGAALVGREVRRMVVTPLERLGAVVGKLAGTVCFLQSSAAHGECDLSGGGGGDCGDTWSGGAGAGLPLPSDASEVFSTAAELESILAKLTHIFRVQPDSSVFGGFGGGGGGGGGSVAGSGGSSGGDSAVVPALATGGAPSGSKGLSMLAGSKSTEIRTADSVLSIEVVERPRPPSVSLASIAAWDDGQVIDLERAAALELRELSSVESALAHPLAAAHLRLYLEHARLLECFLFHAEVERFRSIVRAHSARLYAGFVSPRAASQINVSAGVRHQVEAGLANPAADMFDSAQAECVGLIRGHWKLFLESRFAQAFAKMRLKQRGRALPPPVAAAAPATGGVSAGSSPTPTARAMAFGATAITVDPVSSPSSASAPSGNNTGRRGCASPPLPSDNGPASPSARDDVLSPPARGLLGVPSVGGARSVAHNRGAGSSSSSSSSSSVSDHQHRHQLSSSMSSSLGDVPRRYIPGQTEMGNLAATSGSVARESSRLPGSPLDEGEEESPSHKGRGRGGQRQGAHGGAGSGVGGVAAYDDDFDTLDAEVRNLIRPGWESEALANPVAFHRSVGSSASLRAAEVQYHGLTPRGGPEHAGTGVHRITITSYNESAPTAAPAAAAAAAASNARAGAGSADAGSGPTDGKNRVDHNSLAPAPFQRGSHPSPPPSAKPGSQARAQAQAFAVSISPPSTAGRAPDQERSVTSLSDADRDPTRQGTGRGGEGGEISRASSSVRRPDGVSLLLTPPEAAAARRISVSPGATAEAVAAAEAIAVAQGLTEDEFRLTFPNIAVPASARANTQKQAAAALSKAQAQAQAQSAASSTQVAGASSPGGGRSKLTNAGATMMGSKGGSGASGGGQKLSVPGVGASAGLSVGGPGAASSGQHGTPRPRQLSRAELEAESLRLMLPAGARSGATSTGDLDVDDEIMRLVNPGAEAAKLTNPGASGPGPRARATPAASAAAAALASKAPAAYHRAPSSTAASRSVSPGLSRAASSSKLLSGSTNSVSPARPGRRATRTGLNAMLDVKAAAAT